jgi:transcriptional regulator
MSIYNPSHFVSADRAAMLAIIRDHPFATLVTPHEGEPTISHVPLLHVEDGSEHGALIGHFARANPHGPRAAATESIAVFHGPHAYVSPAWYEQPDRMVPTWNYIVVHAQGTLEPVVDATQVLDALVDRFESGRAQPWRFAMAEPQRSAMIKAITAFRMPIRTLTGKFKLSQNRSAADRERVAAALRQEGYADATATAAWMDRNR